MKSHPIIIPPLTKALRLPNNKIMCREERGVNIFVQFYFLWILRGRGRGRLRGLVLFKEGVFHSILLNLRTRKEGKENNGYGANNIREVQGFLPKKAVCDPWQQTPRTINCKKNRKSVKVSQPPFPPSSSFLPKTMYSRPFNLFSSLPQSFLKASC